MGGSKSFVYVNVQPVTFHTKHTMQQRTSLQIQWAVIHALMVREMKTRFGAYRLGYAWALLEPLSQILFFSVMYAFGNRTLVGGLAVPVFLATGIAPFLYFKKVISQSLGAVAANQNLFLFRQVRVFDAFLVRFLLEMVTTFVVLLMLIAGAAWLGFDVQLVNGLTFVQAYLLLSFFAFGLGLVFGVLNSLYPEAGKMIPMLLRPLMFVSGTFFSINDMPRDIQEILVWNPLIHAFELMRSAFSTGYNTSLVSFEFLSVCTLSAMTLGMLMFRANWRTMLKK